MLRRPFALLLPWLLALPAAVAQESYPTEYALTIDYDPATGPKVHRPADDFSFEDFRVGDEALRWPLDVVVEPVTPTPVRPNVGTAVRAAALTPSGETRLVRVLAHADQLLFEVGGLKPGAPCLVRCRLRTKTPTIRRRVGNPAPFEPPISNVSIGDPEAGSDLAYEPAADRSYWLQPKGLARVGPLEADGSRWLEWSMRASKDGEANGCLAIVLYWEMHKELLLPIEGVAQRAPAPSRFGWRSGPAFGPAMTEKDLLAEARRLREKLAPFGLTDVQIDEGWQLKPEGSGAARVWKPDPAKFPRGLAPVAAELRSLGFRPGIWVIPQAADAQPGTPGLTVDAENVPIPGGWVGPHVWDGTTPEGRARIREAVEPLVKAGFERLYVEGQSEVLERYREAERSLVLKFDAAKALRGGLGEVRAAAGKEAYLSGGWGPMRPKSPAPLLAALGLLDSIRVYNDNVGSRVPFDSGTTAAGIAGRFNGLLFAADPDVVFVGNPLTLGEARSWATAVSLQGLPFFLGERIESLDESRIEVLRRTLGGPAVRSFYVADETRRARRIDLWRERGGETSLVTAHFAFSSRDQAVTLALEDPSAVPFAVAEKLEFWSGRFLGRAPAESEEVPLHVEPRTCLVVAARMPKDRPMVLSTSRHVTQGEGDLSAERWDSERSTLSATSELVANDSYEARIVLPTRAWRVAKAEAGGLPCEAAQEGRLVRLRLRAPESRPVAWSVAFTKDAAVPSAAPAAVEGLRATPAAELGVHLEWSDARSRAGTFLVKRDGIALAFAATTSFTDASRELRFGRSYRYEVVPVNDEGYLGEPAVLEHALQQPARVSLLDLGWDSVRAATSTVNENACAAGGPLVLRGKTHASGLGVAASAQVDFPLRGARGALVGIVGIDDVVGKRGSAEVAVLIDGKFVAKTRVLRGGERPFDLRVPIPAGEILSLRFDDAGDGMEDDAVDLVEAEIRLAR